MKKRIPVTVITGFLGAGKTTLLRHILKNSNLRLAVVINEFGSVGLDGDLIKSCGFCPEEEVQGRLVELNNGCLCCTVQEDFLPTMEALLARSENLDGIIVETSGLALPRPLLQALDWPEIRANLFVNGLVTMVDSESLSLGSPIGDLNSFKKQQVEDKNIDHLTPVNELFDDQLQSADMVLLSRADKISSDSIRNIRNDLLKKVRPGTSILEISHGQIDTSIVLGLRSSSNETTETAFNVSSHHDHNHLDVVSESLRYETEIIQDHIEELLIPLANEFQILRLKGRFWIKNKMLPLQVQMVGPRFSCWFEKAPLNAWKPENSGLDIVVLSLNNGAGDAIKSLF